jgi:SAM-dependent methyltransferase
LRCSHALTPHAPTSDLLATADGATAANEDDASIDTSKSWELVAFDDVARHTEPLLARRVLSESAESADDDVFVAAQAHWDAFYRQKHDSFFQTRHYLHHAFPELLGQTPRGPPGNSVLNHRDGEPLRNAELAETSASSSSSSASSSSAYDYADALRRCGITQKGAVLLEAGCGTGSSLFSLGELLPEAQCAGCDLSAHAIDLVRRHADYAQGRFLGFVWDLSRQALDPAVSGFVQAGSVDVVTSIFMLSAVHPQLHVDSLLRLRALLKPGGLILFRDYGRYDMTQVRFHARGNRVMAPNLYVRGDQTVAYFFSLDDVRAMAAAVNLSVLRVEYDVRKLINRKRKLTMYRVWIVAVLQRNDD